MSANKYIIIISLLINSFQLIYSASGSSSDRLKELIKQSRPNFKVKCQDLVKDFKPSIEYRTFLVTSDQKSLISKHAKNSTFERLSNQCPSSIEENAHRLELVWRYQFFESAHCIRVELDLGNLTQFRQVLDYNYYMFSYRELGYNNIHLKRQLIQDQVNSLTINRAYIKPYIVCVSFFKRDFSLIPSNGSNQTEADCKRFSQDLLDDQKLQNVDLCIDIDTPEHFLSIKQGHEDEHGFHGINRELVMVVFILCLVGFVLATIATCRFMIDRPRKRRYKQVKEYLTKRTANLFQSTGSHGSLNKDRLLGSNPSMVIVSHLQENLGGSQQFETPEAEALLSHGHGSNSSLPSCQEELPASVVPATQNHAKITFSVGETILEDLAGEATSGESKEETGDQKAPEDVDPANNEEIIEGSVEALKTVSHLLDDKPWSLTRRDSKPFIVEKASLNPVNSQVKFSL